MMTESGTQSQDFDLNLAPIIDCFVVLIAFVMISSAFASIAILDAGVSAGGDTTDSLKSPPIQISIGLRHDRSAVLRVSGKEKLEKSFSSNQTSEFRAEI